jgi:hypothetical protein
VACIARLTLVVALVAAALLTAALAQAHSGHYNGRIGWLAHSERTWQLKTDYWVGHRRIARVANLSHERCAYAAHMLRSRSWHRVKRVRQLAWTRERQLVHYRRTDVPVATVPSSGDVPVVAAGLPGPPRIVPLGHELWAEGYTVGGHPAFGGVCRCHAPGSKHYVGRALDINDGPGGEPTSLDALAPRLRVARRRLARAVARRRPLRPSPRRLLKERHPK